MKVIIPDRVQSKSSGFVRPRELRVLRFVFCNNEDRPASGGLASSPGDARQNVISRTVEDLLGSIEPKAIEMKLVDPVAGIAYEEFTNRSRVDAVEINRLA